MHMLLQKKDMSRHLTYTPLAARVHVKGFVEDEAVSTMTAGETSNSLFIHAHPLLFHANKRICHTNPEGGCSTIPPPPTAPPPEDSIPPPPMPTPSLGTPVSPRAHQYHRSGNLATSEIASRANASGKGVEGVGGRYSYTPAPLHEGAGTTPSRCAMLGYASVHMYTCSHANG
jgi:hypothetical protein